MTTVYPDVNNVKIADLLDVNQGITRCKESLATVEKAMELYPIQSEGWLYWDEERQFWLNRLAYWQGRKRELEPDSEQCINCGVWRTKENGIVLACENCGDDEYEPALIALKLEGVL